MRSYVKYLISGSTATTGTCPVLGMDNFTVSMHGQNNLTIPPSGTLTLDARVDGGAPYINLNTIILIHML